ncbi:MAG: PsiF family protein [Pseudomonadota bacterium]|nr:PsiF family protein [Pseudomonadota bacterium]
MLLPGAVWAAAPAAARGQSASTAPAAAPPANRAPAAQVTPEGSATDAAARHAKRRECLQQAKGKKLLGTHRTTFIKDCIAAR